MAEESQVYRVFEALWMHYDWGQVKIATLRSRNGSNLMRLPRRDAPRNDIYYEIAAFPTVARNYI